jgi:hypothetical protein
MQINLSEEQVRELKRALDMQLHGLETELVRTDDRAYREGLKESMAVLEGIRQRLDARFGETPNFSP